MVKKSPKKDQTEQRIAELTHDVQRIQAEFINYKNRAENEKLALAEFAKSQVVKDLLPVIDDLERALAHQPKELKDNKWAEVSLRFTTGS
jgi:molecular chaperone GrpE